MSVSPLLQAAKAFEADVVVPHCCACERPCCGLTDVVLELSFPQVQALYSITKKKREFDAALPSMIRRQGDRYYAHGEPCPAYETKTQLCKVYATSTKPQSCSDFPVYDDGDAVTADLRCEAVRDQLEGLRARLRAVAPGRIVEERDPDHPDTFISFLIKPLKQQIKSGGAR
ncbi:MAG: YkgJ family cysteine cluster protein [Deltaproteobacteria bacterium]|nr:YkgJ family cysteine cluster protein [Deltaproteobacteria bacterium]